MVDIKNNGILLRTYIYLMISLQKTAIKNMGLSTGYSPFLSGPKPVEEDNDRERMNEIYKALWLDGSASHIPASSQNSRPTYCPDHGRSEKQIGISFFRSDEPVFEENAPKKREWSMMVYHDFFFCIPN